MFRLFENIKVSQGFSYQLSELDPLKTLFRDFKCECFLAVLIGFFLGMIGLLPAITFAYLLKTLHKAGEVSHYVMIFVLFLFSLSGVTLFFLNKFYLKRWGLQFLLMYMLRTWSHIFNLSLKKLKIIHSGEVIQKLVDYETALSSLISKGLSILLDVIFLIFLMGLIAWICRPLFWVGFLIYGVCFLCKWIVIRKYIESEKEVLSQKVTISVLLNEVLLQIKKCRSAGIENILHRKWWQALLKQKSYEADITRLDIFSTAMDLLAPVLWYLVVFFVFQLGNLEGITFIPCMICVAQFSMVFERFSREILNFSRTLPSLNRVQDILKVDQIEQKDRGGVLSEIKGDIQFSGVSWKPEGAKNGVLKSFSMRVKPGQFVGLVGASGAGKTTLLKLLLGFEQPLSGAILIDGINMQYLNVQALRKSFGVVLQTTCFFPGSIFSNIAVNHHVSLDEAWFLAKKVGLDKDIEKMPMQMHTHISDDVEGLVSGGQKQKILIARALAGKPKVLLLDEATSALDNQSQLKIHAYLKELNVTRIVVAHRHSVLQGADVVYRLG